MKLLLLFLAVAAALWLTEDYEIFKLNDKVRGDVGADTTFYSWLNLEKGPKSTLDEISKAYRKASLKLHPDKFSGKSKALRKQAEARFQRLSLIGNILKDPALKQRYDYFLRNGFPQLKGRDYLYLRFRPGLLLTLFVLYIIVGAASYLVLCISRRQDYKRIAAAKQALLREAWGSDIPNGEQRVTGPNGAQFRVSATGEVCLDENGVLTVLDENDIVTRPSLKELWLFLIPAGAWNLLFGKWARISTHVNQPQPRKVVEGPSLKKPKKKTKGTKLANGMTIRSRK